MTDSQGFNVAISVTGLNIPPSLGVVDLVGGFAVGFTVGFAVGFAVGSSFSVINMSTESYESDSSKSVTLIV